MADEEVYIGKFPSDGRHVKSGKIDWESPGWREIKNQQMPPPETLPLPIYAGERMERFERLPPAFIASAFLACGPLADVFRKFDLGNGYVVPVQLYRFAKVTPETPEMEVVDVDYHMVSLSQKKQCFLPTESTQVRRSRYDSGPNAPWSVLEHRPTTLERAVVHRPVRGTVDGAMQLAHPSRLTHWTRQVNPQIAGLLQQRLEGGQEKQGLESQIES